MRTIPYKYVFIILLLFAVSFASLRWWQGPKLEGYLVAFKPLLQTVVATGQVISMSRTQVGSEITATVLERRVIEGDHVAANDILLVLRSDDIAAQVRQAQAALAELSSSRWPQAILAVTNAEIQLAQANREIQRRRDLSQRSLLSMEALEQAEEAALLAKNTLEIARLKSQALAPDNIEEVLLKERLAVLQAQLAKTVVRAQAQGTILTRHVEPGDLVQAGKVLFTIALDGNTELSVQLDERNLSKLALNQYAIAIADAYTDKPFPARINFTAPSIDSQLGTVEVRLSIDPVPDFLRQDMTVSVNIETARKERALVVPNDALNDIKGNKAKVILFKDGKLKRQAVKLGLRGLAMSEVVSGLSDGDHVLADPTLSLAEGSRIRLSLKNIPLASDADAPNTQNEIPVKLN